MKVFIFIGLVVVFAIIVGFVDGYKKAKSRED